MKIDLSILKRSPRLDVNAQLIIRPLAPLSMVNEMPGSFYKTLRYPSKKMICGLIENMLGWHFDRKIRNDIFNDWKKVMKKQGKVVNIKDYQQGSTYIPLLMDYFELSEKPSLVDFKGVCNYIDLWNKCYRRDDDDGLYKHLNGCRNLDDYLIAERQIVLSFLEAKIDKAKKQKDKEAKNEAERERKSWLGKHIDQIPCFYTKLASREYFDLDATYSISLNIDRGLIQMLEHTYNGICYLGNSEGWVHVSLKTN